MTDQPYPEPPRPTIDDLDPEIATADRLRLRALHARAAAMVSRGAGRAQGGAGCPSEPLRRAPGTDREGEGGSVVDSDSAGRLREDYKRQ
ncbi:MAG: hypothetical protein IPM75_19025 [Candidatus Competibacteraceae bacterium]|nr:hypothetical protein [Candidatus Competibacteraceae bacterium]